MRDLPYADCWVAQFQFAFGTGNNLPRFTFFLVQSGPDQYQQLLFPRRFLRFRRQCQRMPGEQVCAFLRFGFVDFQAMETKQRLNGHSVLAIAGVGKIVIY